MTTQTVPTLTPEQAAEQTRILRVGSGVEAYRFAYKVPGADIPALQRPRSGGWRRGGCLRVCPECGWC